LGVGCSEIAIALSAIAGLNAQGPFSVGQNLCQLQDGKMIKYLCDIRATDSRDRLA
jgi:hypothetical protein